MITKPDLDEIGFLIALKSQANRLLFDLRQCTFTHTHAEVSDAHSIKKSILSGAVGLRKLNAPFDFVRQHGFRVIHDPMPHSAQGACRSLTT